MSARALLAAAVVTTGACAPTLMWHGHDPHRRRRVEVRQDGDGQYVVVDGRAGPHFDAVGVELLRFGPKGRRIAYPAMRDGRWHVIVEGRPSAAYDGIGALAFGPEGVRLAFVAQRDRRWVVVADGHEQGPWPAVLRGTLGYGDDGRLSYAVRSDDDVRVVVDGRPGPRFDAVDEPVRAPGSGRIAYLARRGERCGPVVDGRWGPRDGAPRCIGLRFGPVGKRLVWAIDYGEHACLVVDGRRRPASCGAVVDSVRFSDDGNRMGYLRRAEGRVQVIVDGGASSAFDWAEPPAFGGAGSHWGYIGGRGDRSYVVVDGRVRGVQGDAADLVFDASGEHHAYVARHDGRWAVVHDGRARVHDLVLAGTLVLTERGRRVAYIAGDAETRELYVAIDGRRLTPVPLDEVAGRVLRDPWIRPPEMEAELRRWVRAEVELARRARPPNSRP